MKNKTTLTLYSPLRALAYQLNANITSTFPQIEVKDHPASLVVTCGLHIKSSNHFSLSRAGLLL